MTELIRHLDTVLFEVAAFSVIFAVLFGAGRWLKRSQRVELGGLYVLFCVAVAVWLPMFFSPVGFVWKEALLRHIGAVIVLLGTSAVLALVRRYFWEGWFERQNQMPAPKFLSQLVGLIIFIGALLLVIGGVYGRAIQGALFGSTVVIGIVGFAMQDLLGNVIAGIALEIGKPFKPGDWLVVDGRHAEVIEVNWRSTRLRDNDAIYIDIPNKNIVGTTIVNLTYPTREHAIRLTVGFDYAVPPNYAKDCMVRAAARAPGVLAKPAPKVFLKEFGDSAIHYEIKFWLEDESRYNDIVDAIKTNVWYEAQRSGIRIPFPIRTLQIEKARPGAQPSLETARNCARKQPFLQLLDEAQTDKLLSHARLLRFGRGERVIEQGDGGGSMFIMQSGTASVVVNANGVGTEVASLGGGDYFGEMSLLTGEPRSATVVAQTDCELWEIGKEVLAEILQNNETLVGMLSDLLAKRRIENEGLLASSTHGSEVQQKQREYRASFLSKVTSFFEL